MKCRLGVSISVVVLICTASWPLSSDSANPTQDAQTIAVGDSLKQAKAKLSVARIEFHNGGFAFRRIEDRDNLICVIGENGPFAAVHYSTSRQVVTGISLVFFPSRRHEVDSETWVDAQSISFEPDRSYRVHLSSSKKQEAALQNRALDCAPFRKTPPR